MLAGGRQPRGHHAPYTNRGVFIALVQHGLVPPERLEHWADMAGFRNVLVHGYDDIDLDVVYDVLQEPLEALEAFGHAALGSTATDVARRVDPGGQSPAGGVGARE